eukprot:CAMPEP_0184294346 /NCGR_PEP_ID=MMETSP1049-20130417/5560_1 /TAXON_ID=77928 /ORGANISM="Proteomonas sulcata, Strain CCMP704" /LENGTH=76 /DNA_ID=CAMNT_0026602597 /DNA_START=49 /DNA_END=279 /DNA_ORIENTATION=+
MYALDIVGRSVTTLMTVANNQARKVLFPAQLAGLARYGCVAGGAVLWFTHPYGVSFINQTVQDIVSPPPPAKPVED